LFEGYREQFLSINRDIVENNSILSERFRALSDELKRLSKEGTRIDKCHVCSYAAAVSTHNNSSGSFKYNLARCLLCNSVSHFTEFSITCSECEEVMVMSSAEDSCGCCGREFSISEIAEAMSIKDEPNAYCDYCQGYFQAKDLMCTVAALGEEFFICLSCFEVYDQIYTCSWCGEHQTGDVTMADLDGCIMCDGNPRL
jgi:hypothetical protein